MFPVRKNAAERYEQNEFIVVGHRHRTSSSLRAAVQLGKKYKKDSAFFAPGEQPAQ